MPVLAIAAARRAPELKPEQWAIVGGLVIAGAALIFAGMRQAPGGIKVPAAQTEDVKPFTPPRGAPVVGPDQHLGGVIFTPHRYPALTGQEFTALINGGHATLRLPHARDVNWLTCPPSEDTL
jgi:hypothetical protein